MLYIRAIDILITILQRPPLCPVFKRILRLMEHLVSKRMLNLKSTALSMKISTTIAHLLSFDVVLRQSIAQDLVNFCFDLSVVREAKLLDFNVTVRIALFTETTGSESDYFLDLTSVDAIHALQASVISIILEFSSRHRSQRLVSDDARRNADALFDWKKSIPTILAFVRQILLAPLELAPTKAVMLSVRTRVAALELIHEFVREWQEIGATAQLDEVILTVVAAIQWYFSSFGKLKDCRERLAELLRNLLLDTALFTPQIRGGLTHNLAGVRSLVLTTFSVCVGHMPLVLAAGGDEAMGLCNLILQSVDLMMIHETTLVERAAHHYTTNGVFPVLFKFLRVSNVDTRVATIKILQTFIESKGHAAAFLSTSCRFAVLALEQQEAVSERKSSEKTTPRKELSATRKRRAIPISPEGRSPVKLVFEPSPKRMRSNNETSTPSPQETSTVDPWRKDSVSLADSFRVFLTGVLLNANQIQRKCQQIPCGLNPLDDNDQSLLGDLSGCVSGICLLLPVMLFGEASEGLSWVSRVVALLRDALAETSVVLEIACQQSCQNLCSEDDRLARIVGLLVDCGLVSHVAYLRSLRIGRSLIDECSSKFWEKSSRLVWAAMARLATAVLPCSAESVPWQAFCSRCSVMMRFLNIPRTQSRLCLCTLRRTVTATSDEPSTEIPSPSRRIQTTICH